MLARALMREHMDDAVAVFDRLYRPSGGHDDREWSQQVAAAGGA
jgi:hypothetical protein